MPSLRELLDFVRTCAEQSGQTFSEDLTIELERQIQAQYATERIYVPPPSSREQSGRTDRIRAMAKDMPTAAVAERLGVSDRYVRKVVGRGIVRRSG